MLALWCYNGRMDTLLADVVTRAARHAPARTRRSTRLYPSFTEFKRRMAPALDGYVHAPHINLLDDAITRLLARAEDGNAQPRMLIVSMPPRHSKSLSVCRALPAYYLAHYPDRVVVLAAHTSGLAQQDFSRKVRDMFHEPVYQSMYSARLHPDHATMADWGMALPYRGGMKAFGVTGAAAGSGADLLIVDDVFRSLQESESQLIRDRVYEGFRADLWTRRHGEAVVVVVGTRWHPDDLIGRILDNPDVFRPEEYEYLRLPALSEGPGDPLGRPQGDVLWPERYTPSFIQGQRRVLGGRHFAALYQQDPLEAVGALFRREWIQHAASKHYPPDFRYVVIAVDPAVSVTSTSDETGIIVAALKTDNTLLVLDDLTFKGTPREWAETTIAAMHRYHANSIVVEANQGGDMVLETLRSVDPSARVRKIHAHMGKQLRFQPVASLYEQGLVQHEEPFPLLEQQMLRWAPNDTDSPDRLDAACYALTELHDILLSQVPRVQPARGFWTDSSTRDRGGPRL